MMHYSISAEVAGSCTVSTLVKIIAELAEWTGLDEKDFFVKIDTPTGRIELEAREFGEVIDQGDVEELCSHFNDEYKGHLPFLLVRANYVEDNYDVVGEIKDGEIV